MPIYENESDFPVPTWTKDDVTVLEAIDPLLHTPISRLLAFLIAERGLVHDQTLDMVLVFNAIINNGKDKYSFDDVEKVLAVSSEFCLIDCVYDNQVLSMVELRDNSVLFLAMCDECSLSLEAAVLLSQNKKSLLHNSDVRPSLSLFGEWEKIAVELLSSMLTRGSLSASIGTLMSNIEEDGFDVGSEVEFVDLIRKLSAVGLFSVGIDKSEKAIVSVEPKASGLFLLFSGRVEMAKTLAEISI